MSVPIVTRNPDGTWTLDWNGAGPTTPISRELLEHIVEQHNRAVVLIDLLQTTYDGSQAPCDWDMQAHCVRPGCCEPATHEYLVGMAVKPGAPVFELVCCKHAREAQP